MQRFKATITAVLAGCAILMSNGAQAQSGDRSGSLPTARELRREAPLTGGARGLQAGVDVATPMGWADFCAQPDTAEDCKVSPLEPVVLRAGAAQMRALDRINRNVNLAVAPMSDADNYGVEERWAYPTNGRGDCEDYVLLKRRLLIEAGFPRQALLITVVRERNGDGHAVLTVVTDKGDLILDNKRDAIRKWSATGYSFIKRQSAEDPNRWVDLRASAMMTAAR
jgi:predicted transglutaminase-like cysteine proteinase